LRKTEKQKRTQRRAKKGTKEDTQNLKKNVADYQK
jgi:hypothetical protein